LYDESYATKPSDRQLKINQRKDQVRIVAAQTGYCPIMKATSFCLILGDALARTGHNHKMHGLMVLLRAMPPLV
jgi:hypothetical protein